MLQDIVVWIIIASAIGYIIYSVVKSLSVKQSSTCDDCSGCDVRKEVQKNIRLKQQAPDFYCGSHQKKH